MLNKLRCHTLFEFPANQIPWSRLLIQIHTLNGKQCRARSVGQKPTDLDLHCLQRQGISGFSRTMVNIRCSIVFGWGLAFKNGDNLQMAKVYVSWYLLYLNYVKGGFVFLFVKNVFDIKGNNFNNVYSLESFVMRKGTVYLGIRYLWRVHTYCQMPCLT